MARAPVLSCSSQSLEARAQRCERERGGCDDGGELVHDLTSDVQNILGILDGGGDLPNKGRACKIYTLMPDGWKMLHQPGTMQYPVGT